MSWLSPNSSWRKPVGTRWHSLSACMFTAASTGLLYGIGIYSEDLKEAFNYGQDQIDTLAAVATLGAGFGFIPGYFADKTCTRLACFVCGLLSTVGLALFWLLARKLIDPPGGPFAWMVGSYMVAVLGAFGTTAAAFSMLVRNFPENRGLAVGAAKGWVGLSVGLATQVYEGFIGKLESGHEEHDTLNFILLCAIFTSVSVFFSLPWMCDHEIPQSSDASSTGGGGADMLEMAVLPPCSHRRCHSESLYSVVKGECRDTSDLRFYTSYTVTLIAMTLVIISSAFSGSSQFAVARTVIASALCLLYLSLSRIPQLRGNPQQPLSLRSLLWPGGSKGGGEREAPLYSEAPGAGAEEEAPWDPAEPEALLEERESQLPELTAGEVVLTWKYYCFLLQLVATYGGGLTIINNLGQICVSRRIASSSTSETLLSVGQCMGRLSMGLVSELGMQRRISRVLIFMGLMCLMLFAHLILLLPRGADGMVLQIAVLVCGFAYGGSPPMSIMITSELYGSKHLAGNYMLNDGVAIAVGAMLLGKLLTQMVYDAHLPHGENKCYGTGCFQLTHVVVAGLLVVALAAGYLLYRKTLPLYREIWRTMYKKAT